MNHKVRDRKGAKKMIYQFANKLIYTLCPILSYNGVIWTKKLIEEINMHLRL